MTALTTLHRSANSLEMLNLSGLNKLEYLWCFNNPNLSRLDGLQDCTSLKTFSCGSCKLDRLDVTALINLKELYCDSMDMTELTGLVNKTNLNSLNCSGNKLEQLDITGCVNMNKFFGNHNNLTEIKGLKDCTAMADFRCHKNKLNALDLSALPDSCNLKYNDNSFTEVALRNGKVKIENTANGTAYITEIKPAENKVLVTTTPDTGYVFQGWYTDAAMTEANKIDFEGNITADINLYPKFSAIISNVTVSDLPANIAYGDVLDLAITGITAAGGYNADDAVYKWYEGENDFGAASPNYTYTVNDIAEHTISCDITLGGYTVTKTFTFTASPKMINTAIPLAAPRKTQLRKQVLKPMNIKQMLYGHLRLQVSLQVIPFIPQQSQ